MERTCKITPEPRSIIEGSSPRSRRTAGNRFSLMASCQSSSVTVTKPPLGAVSNPFSTRPLATAAKVRTAVGLVLLYRLMHRAAVDPGIDATPEADEPVQHCSLLATATYHRRRAESTWYRNRGPRAAAF